MAETELFQIKKLNTSRPLKVTLSNDLTGASVRFQMVNLAGDLIVDAAASIITPAILIDGVTSAIVQYQWAVNDLANAGTYRAEFKVTYPDATKETFPADGYITVEVEDSFPLEQPRGFVIDTTGAEKLCTDQMIRDYLEEVTEFPDSLYDAPNKLAELKTWAKMFLESQTGLFILWKDITAELHDGNQRHYLAPKRPPMLTVTNVTLLNDLPLNTPRILVEGTDYFWYPDHLMFAAALPRGHQNVSLSYRSGIAPTVSLATADAVARVAALRVMMDISSGPAETSSISAGPVSLREAFPITGKYSAKSTKLLEVVRDWIKSKKGYRWKVVGEQKNPRGYKKSYCPRTDNWI